MCAPSADRRPRVLADVVALLACPHCGAVLAPAASSLRCAHGHAFDVARQGYVNLLPGDARTGTADTAAMIRARTAVLGAGHFEPLAQHVAATAAEALQVAGDGGVLDLGAGPGYYLAHVLGEAPDRVGLALDLSKYAMRRAARAHRRIGAAVCDVWRRLPVRDAVMALALSVFAPRNGPELARVLRPSGAAIVVTPTERHLRELVPALDLLSVDAHKAQRLEAQLGPHLALEAERPHEHRVTLRHADVEALVAMGPSAWHTDPAEIAGRVALLPEPLTVTLSVTLSTYRRR